MPPKRPKKLTVGRAKHRSQLKAARRCKRVEPGERLQAAGEVQPAATASERKLCFGTGLGGRRLDLGGE